MILRFNNDYIDRKLMENAMYAKINNLPNEVCEYYIKEKNGKEIAIWDLTPAQIVKYVINTRDINIIHYLHVKQRISNFDNVLTYIKLIKQYEASQSSIIIDIIKSLGGNQYLLTAKKIVEYENAINNNKTTLTIVLKNLSKIEKSKLINTTTENEIK